MRSSAPGRSSKDGWSGAVPSGPAKPVGSALVQRGREVDLAQVEPGVEAARVAEAVEVVARAGEHRDVGARLGETAREGARDERGTATREEERSGHHTQRGGQQTCEYGSRQAGPSTSAVAIGRPSSRS